jgi:hypothetical protein
MMTKPKVEAPDDPAACITIAQKVAYSMMVRAKFEALADDPWSAPSDLGVLMDPYPHDPAMPWTHPEWAEEWARQERARRAIERLVRDAE